MKMSMRIFRAVALVALLAIVRESGAQVRARALGVAPGLV